MKRHQCEKCGVTFGRLDNLQRHVRSVCSSSNSSSCRRRNTTVYTCKKCGRKFERRNHLTIHARTACVNVTEPTAPKTSTREDTTPSHYHPLVTEEDPLEPPDRLPFADTLSTELLDVVRAHWSAIRTHASRGPLQCRYDYRLTTLDTAVLEPSVP